MKIIKNKLFYFNYITSFLYFFWDGNFLLIFAKFFFFSLYFTQFEQGSHF
jgi:hypothetical protein